MDAYYGFLRYANDWLSHRATDVILLSPQLCALLYSFGLHLPFLMTHFLTLLIFAETYLFTPLCNLIDDYVMPYSHGHCILPL